MSELWDKLGHLFYGESEEDCGTLPDLFVKNLSLVEMRRIYSWVRSISTMYTGKGQPTLRHRELQSDIAIADVADPVLLVCEGIAEAFRHGNIDLSVNGSAIPDLSIGVYPNEIQFDYQMGAAWGPFQLEALFDFLFAIQQIAPACEISHAVQGSDWPTHLFSVAWHQYTTDRISK